MESKGKQYITKRLQSVFYTDASYESQRLHRSRLYLVREEFDKSRFLLESKKDNNRQDEEDMLHYL